MFRATRGLGALAVLSQLRASEDFGWGTQIHANMGVQG